VNPLDLKAAKNDLVSQLNCPNFPNHLWLDVLANQYVDLDRVLAGYYSLESDHKRTSLMVTGQSPSPPPSMLSVLYTHRADELSEYEEFISGLFATGRPAALHYKVINLNKAIRVCIAKDNRISLVSYEKFSDLSTHHLVRDSVPATGISDEHVCPLVDPSPYANVTMLADALATLANTAIFAPHAMAGILGGVRG
jgi:hypothetical protein